MRIEIDVNSATGDVTIIRKWEPGPVLPTIVAATESAAPWGRDQFGTAYVSAADRARGENLRENDARQAAWAAQLQPGQSDVRTWTPEDYLFWYTASDNKLAGKVGPWELVVRADAWFTGGAVSAAAAGFPNLEGVHELYHSGQFNRANYAGPLLALV